MKLLNKNVSGTIARGLEISLPTQTAHALHSPHTKNSSTSCFSDVSATSLAVVTTTIEVIKEMGEILQDVPYVKGIAGIVLRILKIKEELVVNIDYCQYLIRNVAKRSEALLRQLKAVAECNAEGLRDLKVDLEEYGVLLHDVHKELVLCTSSSTRFERVLNRSAVLDKLKEHERRMKDFDEIFAINRFVGLAVAVHRIGDAYQSAGTYIPASSAQPMFKSLPPKPVLMVGRDDELLKINEIFSRPEPARIVILGGGGMGKTTLAQSVLYDDRVVRRYPTRYFFACDGLTSIELLLTEMANVLRIPSENRGQELYVNVLDALSKNAAVICLDNFEDIWDIPTTRRNVEELLAQLTSIPTLAVIVTLRGTQRPAGVHWSQPFLSALSPLTDADAATVFRNISGRPVDEYAEKLIHAVDCVPLAVCLLANLAQPDYETTQALWKRWEQRGIALVDTGDGAKHRLSSLDFSIRLSLSSPRIQNDPTAPHVLSLVSILPDGLPAEDDTVDALQERLPNSIDLRKTLALLARTSLIYMNVGMATRRYRILSPIRKFAESHLSTPNSILSNLRNALIDFYIKKINTAWDYIDPTLHQVIPPELLNIRSVLTFAFSTRKVELDTDLIGAAITYTEWSIYMGSPSDVIMKMVMEQQALKSDRSRLDAECCLCFADVCLMQDRLDEAEASLTRAVKLHQQVHDLLGEANDRSILGDVYLRQSRLDEAEASLTRAVDLHREVHAILGEANDCKSLGRLYMRRDQLDLAEASLSRAVELHQRAHAVLGEANDRGCLGDLHLRQDRLDEAEASLTRAVKLHQQARDVLGEANDCQILGDLYRRQDRLDIAEASLTRAIELHQQAHSVFGEANDRRILGNVYLQQNRLDETEASLTWAVELHRRAHDVLGEANDHDSLGDLYMRLNRPYEAKASLTSAVELYQRAHSVFGEAIAHESFGDFYCWQNRLDEAETSLNRALLLYQRAHSTRGEAHVRQLLNNLYFRRGIDMTKHIDPDKARDVGMTERFMFTFADEA